MMSVYTLKENNVTDFNEWGRKLYRAQFAFITSFFFPPGNGAKMPLVKSGSEVGNRVCDILFSKIPTYV